MAVDVARGSLAADLSRFRASRDRGIGFVLGLTAADGTVGNPDDGFVFYRAPWSFQLTGHSEVASAVCGWVRRHMLQPDGTLDGGIRTSTAAYGYIDSTFIYGAHLAGQFDLSEGLMPRLLGWQDERSGGFANDLLPGGEPGDDMDVWNACGPGFASLVTGHRREAGLVAEFLGRIHRAQPNLPRHLYFAWSRERQALITEFDAAAAATYVVDNELDARQSWVVGGIAAAFLGRLYLVDRDPELLSLARAYQDFSMAATPAQFNYASACKSGWGGAVLYQVTGEDRYLEWTRRMGDWFAGRQRADGAWGLDETSTGGTLVWVTLEFVMHMDTIINALASHAA